MIIIVIIIDRGGTEIAILNYGVLTFIHGCLGQTFAEIATDGLFSEFCISRLNARVMFVYAHCLGSKILINHVVMNAHIGRPSRWDLQP